MFQSICLNRSLTKARNGRGPYHDGHGRPEGAVGLRRGPDQRERPREAERRRLAEKKDLKHSHWLSPGHVISFRESDWLNSGLDSFS